MPKDLTSGSALDPLSAVRRRLMLFTTSQDRRYLTGPQAEAEYAAALAAAVRFNHAGRPEHNITAMAELARFRFWRGATSGTLAGKAEADEAVRYFVGLRQAAGPGLVPAEIADLVEALLADLEQRLAWTVQCADTLLSLGNGTDVNCLGRAIDVVAWALRAAPPDLPDRIFALGRLGMAYHGRYEATKNVDDALNAVAVRKEAVDLSLPGKDRARRLSLLADSLLALHEQTKEKSHLHDAVQALKESIAATLPDDEFIWLRYQRLARAHRALAEVSDSIADLDAAVKFARLACARIDASQQDYEATLTTLDRSLCARYEKTRDRADLDESVMHWRRAVVAIPAGDIRRADFLRFLGNALHNRFEREGDESDLDESIEKCNAAVVLAPEGSAHWVSALSDLCYRLHCRFKHRTTLADLHEAIRVGRLAVAIISPDGGEDAVLTYSNLLNADIAYYDTARSLPHLDEAINLVTMVSEATPADHPERGRRLASILPVIEKRFEYSGDRNDLDRLFRAAHDSIEAPRPDFGQIAETLLRVAGHLDTRAEVSSRPAHIGRLIDNARFEMRSRSAADLGAMNTLVDLARLVAPQPETDDHDRLVRLEFLATTLAIRYRVTGPSADGAESISLMREITATADPSDQQYSRYLSNLGDALVSRFVTDGDATDLDEAVEADEHALRAALPADPDREVYLRKLTSALQLRYDDRRDPEDLHRVVAVIRDAVADGRPAPDCRRASLIELASVLQWRFYYTNDPADLDAAVEAARHAADYDAGIEARAGTVHSAFAYALFTRYQQTGNPADLDDAISILESTLADVHDNDESRPKLRFDHALYVHARALRTGSSEDLDRSVAEFRELTSAQSPDDPRGAVNFHSLGMALNRRHVHLGDETDMRSAIEAHRTAFQLAHRDPLLRAITAVGLANALSTLFDRTGDRAVLDEAIALAAEAEHAIPEHGDMVSQPLSALSWLLRTRIDLSDDPDPQDVDEMLRVSKRMINASPEGTSDRGLYLRNRAAALTTAAQVRRDPVLLNQAVATAQQAVDVTELGDGRRAEWLWSLGLILELRHRVSKVPNDLEAALACRREAARDPHGDPDMVTRCALRAGQLSAMKNDMDGAVADYSLAVRHLPTVAWHGLQTAVRSDNLRTWFGLGSEAAGAAIAAGQPTIAVEMLEQSRSIIWTQALHLRSDLSHLSDSHSGLAERLMGLRTHLDAFSSAGDTRYQFALPDEIRGVGHAAEAGERRRLLAREWDETVAQVRRIKGFEHFLAPAPYAELKDAASAGPVVIMNASPHGTHALIVRHDIDEPEVVELSGISIQDVYAKASDLLFAIRAQTDPTTSFLARERARHILHDVLGWLWDEIVEPTLARLQFPAHPVDIPPQLWWCPVGLFSLLPLHAAGHHPRHRSTTGADSEWAGDRVISSYTPTLAALIRSRAPRPEPSAHRHMAIALPETSGLSDLPSVIDEVASFRQHSPNPADVVSLVGPAATRQAVLDEFPRCDRIHFACHAGQHFADPAASAFSMHDGPLSIADIAGLELAGAEMAYLSACQTATGVPDLADEVIHLAAAMQLIGFRHVVATNWSVEDTSAATVAEHFYRTLASRAGDTGTAAALHQAVHALRHSDPTEPVKWASYVHFGSLLPICASEDVTMSNQPHPHVPYEQTSDYLWTETAFRLLESGDLTARVMINGNVSSAVVEGTCPRCAHHITERRTLTAVSSVIGGNRTTATEPGGTISTPPARPGEQEHGHPIVLDVTCSCGTPHPANADFNAALSVGCGVSFRIELVVDRAPEEGQP